MFRIPISLLLLSFLAVGFLNTDLRAEDYGKASAQVALSEDDLLLCIVRLGGNTLAGDLVTFSTPKGLYLPLGEISRMLELGIMVDAAARRGSGFVASASSPFMLDMAASSVMVSGKPCRYEPSLVVSLPDDMYVESRLLAEWLAMRIEVNRFDAAVDIRPFEPLPLQQRMARMARGSNTWGYGSYNDPGYPLLETPWQLLAGPSIDLFLSSSVTGNEGQKINFDNNRFYTRVTGDVLLMNGQLDLSGQIAGPGKTPFEMDNGSLLLQRENFSGGMLGVLSARTVAVGDIPRASLPLIGSSIGPGIIIGNYPLTHSPLFDGLTLSGFLAKGWDVELYRNGSLLDYRPSNPAESYAFIDIPLVYDLNELQLVFHGPQGEQRVETHIYNVGSNMIEPGSWSYQATLSDASKSLLFSSRTGDAAPLMTWKSTLGINKWLTANNSFASALVGTERQSFIGAGFSGYVRMMQLDAQVAGNVMTDQWARQVGLQSRFDPLTISFLLQDYDNNWTTTAGPMPYLRKWDTLVTGIHPFPFFSDSRLSMGYSRTQYSDLRSSRTVQLATINRTWGVNHTHTITFGRTQNSGIASDSLTGISYASLVKQKLSLRAELGYELFPGGVITNLGVNSELHLPREWLLVGSMTYSTQGKAMTISTGLNRTSGVFALGISGSHTAGGVWSAGVQLSTNLSREPAAGHWVSSGSLNSQQAAVSAQAYLDTNRNKKWDPGEPPIGDAGFFVNQQSSRISTGMNGIAFLQGLTPNIPTDISLSSSTLKELLWIPADKGVRVVPRPGYAVPASFPVWVTGEISGTVYRKVKDVARPASGIVVEALDKDGKVAVGSRSEYDGVYTLAALPVGTYTVRLSPRQAHGIADTAAPSREVTIPPEGAYVDAVNLVLEEPASPRY